MLIEDNIFQYLQHSMEAFDNLGDSIDSIGLISIFPLIIDIKK